MSSSAYLRVKSPFVSMSCVIFLPFPRQLFHQRG